MKRFIVMSLLLTGAIMSLSAQQMITRFAVVDMNRLIVAFAEQSPEARAFTDRVNNIQAEIANRTRDLQETVERLTLAQEEGRPASQIRNIENQRDSRIRSLQTFINNSTVELDRERNRLMQGEFQAQIARAVRAEAESGGFSMVLNRDTPGIIWVSPAVDITNRVAERIRSGSF